MGAHSWVAYVLLFFYCVLAVISLIEGKRWMCLYWMSSGLINLAALMVSRGLK